MIPIDAITEDIIETRLDSLPESLQAILADEGKLKVVESICHRDYIADDNKILIIQQIVTLALMGIVNLSDVGKEIMWEADLKKEISDGLVKELDEKIFAPVRADINKAYSPISADRIVTIGERVLGKSKAEALRAEANDGIVKK